MISAKIGQIAPYVRIGAGRLLIAVSSVLVPSGLALLYAQIRLAHLMAPLLNKIAAGPYDGLMPYLALASLGSGMFLALILSLELAAGKMFGVGRGIHLIKIKIDGAKPYGFTTGGLTRWVSFVVLSGGEDPDLERFVELHEEAHAKLKHPAKIWAVGAVLYGEMAALPATYASLGSLPAYVYVFSVALVISTVYLLFVLVRALEVEADIYVFRAMGLRSHDLFVKLMKTRYGSWRQPLRSRLTHTQGEFVLLLGDPIAAHTPWEHLLLFSLLSSVVLLPKISAEFAPAYQNPSAYYVLVLFAILMLNYFLSVASEAILKRLARARLTDRGYTNLARLATGISSTMAAASALTPLPTSIALLILGAFIYYKIINRFINNIYLLSIYIIIIIIIFPLFAYM
ncbi:MAG: hypothetical protein ACP5HD_08915 [Thermoproteus sp.]